MLYIVFGKSVLTENHVHQTIAKSSNAKAMQYIELYSWDHF